MVTVILHPGLCVVWKDHNMLKKSRECIEDLIHPGRYVNTDNITQDKITSFLSFLFRYDPIGR